MIWWDTERGDVIFQAAELPDFPAIWRWRLASVSVMAIRWGKMVGKTGFEHPKLAVYVEEIQDPPHKRSAAVHWPEDWS